VNFGFYQVTQPQADDQKQLDEVLESKSTPDVQKLLRMLRDVNDPDMPINDVIRLHFNMDNYVTWLALNMLLGNFDTLSQNFYLYSPTGCEGWFFLPWDYDGSLGWYEQPGRKKPRGRSRAGMANWWDVPLHRRFFMEPGNVERLEARMAELMAGPISDQRTRQRLEVYDEAIEPEIESLPDLRVLATSKAKNDADRLAQRNAEVARIGNQLSTNLAEYYAVKEWPTPMWLASQVQGDQLVLIWEPSYDFQGDAITYDVEVATTTTFDAPLVVQMTGLSMPGDGDMPPYVSVRKPPKGTYYWRVIARDASNPVEHWQGPQKADGYDTLTIP